MIKDVDPKNLLTKSSQGLHDVSSSAEKAAEQLSNVNVGEATPESTSTQVSTVDARGAQSRFDPITGNWTIFAPDRSRRPHDFISRPQPNYDSVSGSCPFCSGNEFQTPPAVWTGRVGDHDELLICDRPHNQSQQEGETQQGGNAQRSKPWDVRVVPNKFPAVTKAGICGSEAIGKAGLFSSRPVIGGHEVLVESSQHTKSITELDLSIVKLLFVAYQQRIQYWKSQPGIQYISVFKNVGDDAGASLQHSHSQLIATDLMPHATARSVASMQRHRAKTGCCLQCDLVRAEQKAKQRIVIQSDDLIAFCPFASPFPMTVRVTSKDHQSDFDLLSDSMIDQLARILPRLTRWIEASVPNASFNLLLNTRPPGSNDADAFHWSLDLFPRDSRIAGFELSSDCMINTVFPETAAANFRKFAALENPRRVV